MITDEQIKSLEQVLKVEEGTLSTAIKSEEEVSIELPELVVRTKEESETYEKNLKDEEYKSGKVAGSEMMIKEARDKYNLDFDGKTIDNFADALKSKTLTEAKIEPSQKIKELTGDIETLRSNVSEWESKYNSFVTESTQKETKRKLRGEVVSNIPDNTIIGKDKIALLFENEYNLSIEDGKTVVKKGEEVLKSETTREPLGVQDVLTSFLNEGGYVKKEAGRGGEDRAGNAKQGTYEAFVKEMSNKGVSEGGQEFLQEMNKRINDKTLEV